MNLLKPAAGGMPEAHHHRMGELPPFNADYNVEGVRVGYKWFESKDLKPLFPFGFGLSYTSYEFSGLHVDAGTHTVSFKVRNTGQRAGAEVAQIYAVLPASTGESNFKRLIGWDRVELAPGDSKTVTVQIDPIYLSIFNVEKNSFELAPGDYIISAGSSSADLPLSKTVHFSE
jgi:beta-glucosidase